MDFKVGDHVRAHEKSKTDGIIVNISDSGRTVYVKPSNVNTCGMGMVGDSYPIYPDRLKLIYKRVKATKIAKRMYHDRIIKEEDGILTVRNR